MQSFNMYNDCSRHGLETYEMVHDTNTDRHDPNTNASDTHTYVHTDIATSTTRHMRYDTRDAIDMSNAISDIQHDRYEQWRMVQDERTAYRYCMKLHA